MTNDPLTLAKMKELREQFIARMTAEEADAFLRLGEQYPAYRTLSQGGSLVIGNDTRLGEHSKGIALRQEVLRHWPDARVYLTEYLPDGNGIVLPRPACLI